jgi:hypothetical protein
VDEGATSKEEVQRGSVPKKKCLPNEEQQRKRKKSRGQCRSGHEKRISRQLLTENNLEKND